MTTQTGNAYGLRQQGGLEVVSWPALDALDVDVMVTTRHGGVSAGPYATLNLGLHVGDDPADVLENRRRVAAALGADLGDLVFCEQAHGREVRVVTAGDRGRGAWCLDDAIGQADALVTADTGTVLVVMVADCVPVVLHDPVAHVLACVHAGWRGTVARVTEAALTAMQALGARPDNVLAAVGPAAGPADYQVGEEVAAAADTCFGGNAEGIVRPDGTGRWLLDLWAANHRILRESGVPDSQIMVAALPTGTGPGLFFSHRQEHPCGRFAAVARLRPRSRA
ncbi:MAG: peptidoglycan editing factor PgeF [Streptosporangiaceae bacterium]